MGFGMGALGWTPETFWQATVQELKAAAAGRRSACGAEILEEADIRALEALLAGEMTYGDGH